MSNIVEENKLLEHEPYLFTDITPSYRSEDGPIKRVVGVRIYKRETPPRVVISAQKGDGIIPAVHWLECLPQDFLRSLEIEIAQVGDEALSVGREVNYNDLIGTDEYMRRERMNTILLYSGKSLSEEYNKHPLSRVLSEFKDYLTNRSRNELLSLRVLQFYYNSPELKNPFKLLEGLEGFSQSQTQMFRYDSPLTFDAGDTTKKQRFAQCPEAIYFCSKVKLFKVINKTTSCADLNSLIEVK